MKKAILLSLLLSVSAQAHWFGLSCSNAAGNITFIESKMGTELTYLKDNGEELTITTNYSDDLMLEMTKIDEVVLNEINESECNDGRMTYYMSKTYATKAVINFENLDGIFPAGYGVSEDGKSVNAFMICEYTAGGASSCN